MGVGVGVGVGVGLGVGVGFGVTVGFGAGLGVGVATGRGFGFATGLLVAVDLGADVLGFPTAGTVQPALAATTSARVAAETMRLDGLRRAGIQLRSVTPERVLIGHQRGRPGAAGTFAPSGQPNPPRVTRSAGPAGPG